MDTHVNCPCGERYMAKRGTCPGCNGTGSRVVPLLERAVELLEEIAEAFRPPEEVDPAEYTCGCTQKNGGPIANCPLCHGTGHS